MIRRLLRAPVLLAIPFALVVGACSEQLETSASCPLLCPGQELNILDTVLEGVVVFDTTLGGFPIVGSESPLLLASRGDTLDVRAVIRFDTLTRFFTPTGDTLQAVTNVDSAFLSVQLLSTGVKVPQTFFIDAYDVGDTTLVDSLPTSLLPLFTAGRLLGSLQVDSADFFDSITVRVPIDSAKLRAIIGQEESVLRIGLQLRSTESGAFWMTSNESGTSGPSLRYRVSYDSLVPVPTIVPSSSTPRTPADVAYDYADYMIVAKAPDITAATRMTVGGLPSLRSYLRFAIPEWLTDSSAVLSARLELVQDPVYGMDQSLPMTIRAQMVIAGNATTDLNRAARFLAPVGYFITDSLRLAPGDSGAVRFEMNALVRQWRTINGVHPIPSALVLRADFEGNTSLGVRFFGIDADPTLRPRLRVSYVPSIRFGQP
jgi:hypothetical protein